MLRRGSRAAPGMAHCDPFYLNMVITNKAEVIEAKVSEKVGKGMFGLGLARKAASKVAASMVTDEKLASTVSDKMVAAIPAALAERGISADIAKKYGKGAYFVLRVHVTELDKIKLLTTAKGEEFAAKFGQLIELIDYFGATEGKEKMEQSIATKVQQGLMEKLVEILPPKMMEAGGLGVEVIAKTDAEQAEFFFDFLEEQETKTV